ncbi:MAG: nucleotidyltransferase family protein [Chitinophagales bacterium]
MISERAKTILREKKEVAHYLNQVIEHIDPQQVILFGSKAREEADAASDTDLAIVADHFFDTTEIFGAVDIVDLNRVPENLREEILKEGIILYER